MQSSNSFYVISEQNISNNCFEFVFNDESKVIVEEVHNGQKPYFSKVKGDFNEKQIQAILKYSFLETK